jgi:hypothetical protein
MWSEEVRNLLHKLTNISHKKRLLIFSKYVLLLKVLLSELMGFLMIMTPITFLQNRIWIDYISANVQIKKNHTGVFSNALI